MIEKLEKLGGNQNNQKAGGKRPGSGRKPGVPNKVNAMLKDEILAAASDVGQDGTGKDGLRGYLRTVAATDMKAFTGLIGRVLPLQLTGGDGGPVVVEIARFAD